MRASWILLIAFVACHRERDAPPDANAMTKGTANADATAPIGFAKMEPDGTVVVDLTARSGGAGGHARTTYPPSHAEYNKVLEHVGGLRPGESKPVPPWPDPWDAARVEAAARDHAVRVKGWPAGGFQLEITGTDADGNAVVRIVRERTAVQLRVEPKGCTVVRETALP